MANTRLVNKTTEEMWDTDFADLKINENTKKQTKRHADRFFRGGVRISTGRFCSDEEWEKKRERVLITPLP